MIKIKNKMYLFFAMLSLLFLLFNLDPIPGKPAHNHFVLIWTWQDYRLLRIFPHGWYVLVDKDIVYTYDTTESLETYVPAIRMDTYRKHDILHYNYLLDWIQETPVLKKYPPEKRNIMDILNHITKSL